jgi:hypothetical protein
MQAITTVGLDIAKSIFQVHGVDALEEIARGDRSRVMQWFTDPNGAPLNIFIKRQQPAKGR